MDALEQKLGYSFKDKALLARALTHSSAEADHNYERLEFLGDRVLGLVIADTLHEMFPDEKEGHLARRLSALVKGETLADVAQDFGLGDHLILSESERDTGGAENTGILADVMEALIGAVYLEAGLEVAKDLILRLWGERTKTLERPPRDPKTALQEWAQGQGLPLPVYDIVERSGPDHAPSFIISVSVEGTPPAEAKGTSRRLGEKAAARKLLKAVGVSLS